LANWRMSAKPLTRPAERNSHLNIFWGKGAQILT
jgi:hypothetical protein